MNQKGQRKGTVERKECFYVISGEVINFTKGLIKKKKSPGAFKMIKIEVATKIEAPKPKILSKKKNPAFYESCRYENK